jgi:hypothetical protein
VSTWFINSHISSVRKNIQNQFLVDQQAVELKDFANRKTVIRMKKGFSGRPLNTVIQQLPTSDVTGRHIADSEFLYKLMQITTGISENISGQFAGGRRSASEARQVNQGSANRLITHARLIFETALEPLAQKMIKNLQDGLTVPVYLKKLGATQTAMEGAEAFLSVSREDLMGQFEFEVFDGTLPSEKQARANVLKELVLGFLANPETAVLTGYSVDKLLTEILILEGIKNPERFKGQNAAIPTPPPASGGVQQPQQVGPAPASIQAQG